MFELGNMPVHQSLSIVVGDDVILHDYHSLDNHENDLMT